MELRASLFVEGGSHCWSGGCLQLSVGGVFICCEQPPPRLFSILRLRLALPGGEVECGCEVVRHVTASETAAWRMPLGFAVQFLELSVSVKAAIAEATGAAPLASPPPRDVELDRLLRCAAAPEVDHYRLLGLELDCSLDAARRRGHEARARLEAARHSGLTAIELLAMQSALNRVNEALAVLGDPTRRAGWDAAHHNFRGAAQCLAAGLTLSELEASRRRYLEAMPFARSGAASLVLASRAAKVGGDPWKALALHERALALDPLDVELHHAYTRLRAELTQAGAHVAQLHPTSEPQAAAK